MKKHKVRSGDVVCVDRGLYKHYGVYDHGDVIEMSAGPGNISLSSKHQAHVRKESLSNFLNGDPGYVDNSPGKHSRKKTLKRAKKELGSGKGSYDLVNNNCEHKAREWQTGRKYSKQVNGIGGVVAKIIKPFI